MIDKGQIGKGGGFSLDYVDFGGYLTSDESLDWTSVNLGVGVIACVLSGGARYLVIGPSVLMFHSSTNITLTRELDFAMAIALS
jgi:hypothetical protein